MSNEEKLSAEERRAVADYWWSRAEGEMTSFIAFRHVLDDLKAESSPASIVSLAEQAVADEHRHSLWCQQWARHYGHPGGEVKPRSERPLSFVGATHEENRLLRIAFCCFTETVGCFTPNRVRAGSDRQLSLWLRDRLPEVRRGRADSPRATSSS